MGIAEQNLMGTAAGLAASGKTVFASTFAMFATGRAYEIIRNLIAHTGVNVKICATHAGITVGEDGATHQTFEDISLMRGLPGMTVTVPADANSATKILTEAAETKGPFYVRLGRSGVPVIYDEDTEIKVGKANTLRDGSKATVIACGIMVNEALIAAEKLGEKGIDVRVIDMHTIKPLDTKIIKKAVNETGAIVTAEEHSVIGGLGAAVSEYTSQNCPVKMTFVGQQDTFGESGKPTDLIEKYHMTSEDIVKAVETLI
jgi:transketolase